MKIQRGHIVITLVVTGIVSLSHFLGLFSGLELFFEDRLFTEKSIRPDIVIVAIDDESIAKIGQWPWPRAQFAQFVTQLNQAEPSAVGFDVIFSEPSRLGEADDRSLESALQNVSYPIIFPIEAGDTSLSPLPRFADKVALGHINITIDPDGVARTFPFDINGMQPFAYSLLEAAEIAIPNEETLGSRTRIVYAGSPFSFTSIPFYQLLEKDAPLEIRDAILLVGATAADLHDNQATPVSRGIAMPGVEIHANIANMLAEGYRILPLSPSLHYGWFLLATLVPLVVVRFARSLLLTSSINIFVGLLYVVMQILLFENGVAANIIHIHGAWILSAVSLTGYQYFAVDKDRTEMKKVFGKYVSTKVLDEILDHPEQVSLGGEEREITVLFSDIRGFTTLSEGTTPTQLVEVINKYFTAMSNEILKYDGVIDKYIGDAIMAFWGAPLEDPMQADNAVKAALGMKVALQAFNETLKEETGLEIKIGVGLYSGPAVVGNMGSDERFDYTAMGDTVNISSRLEGITKPYGVDTIIGETTFDLIQEKNLYVIREIDQIIVKGKKEPKRIFEPLLKSSLSKSEQEQLQQFEKGRDAYYKGSWNSAIDTFETILRLGPDGPSEELLRRTKELRDDPPRQWEGVYTFTTK